VAAKNPDDDRKQKILALANAIAQQDDCDILLLNFGMETGFEEAVYRYLCARKVKRKGLLLFLTTEGGMPHTAYKIGRRLQDAYENGITIAVMGWCKSAGTLICIAGRRLLMSDTGELGPLDVQIAKADEMWERSSGLVVEAAFEKLQQESFKLFFQHLMDIKEQAGRITFKTAADIAAQMTVGQTKEIFAKIDPVNVGEDYRSNLIAEQYAIRLNLKASNLTKSGRIDGLDMLLHGYPSHGFVIDREEAGNLFKRVAPPAGKIAELAQLLGNDVVVPRNAARREPPKLEFLNAQDAGATKAKGTAKRSAKGRRSGRKDETPRPANLRGRFPLRSKPEGGEREAA
jgi:hypothetical protein